MIAERECELAEAYAIGALDQAEEAAFEAHLVGCEDCRRVVRDQREAVLALAQAVAVKPRLQLRQRLLERRRAAGSRRMSWPNVLALAAGLAGLLLGGVQSVRLARMRDGLSALADSLDRREQRLAEVTLQRNAILNADIRMYYLAPADTTSPRAGAQVYWSRANQSWLLHAFNLPRLTGGRVYQLWYVTESAKISAGVLTPDSEGHAIMVTRLPAEAARSIVGAVSVEPAGGSTQPTGPIVLAGSVAERS